MVELITTISLQFDPQMIRHYMLELVAEGNVQINYSEDKLRVALEELHRLPWQTHETLGVADMRKTAARSSAIQATHIGARLPAITIEATMEGRLLADNIIDSLTTYVEQDFHLLPDGAIDELTIFDELGLLIGREGWRSFTTPENITKVLYNTIFYCTHGKEKQSFTLTDLL